MHEIELKFNVPSHYQASTLQQINTTTAKKQRLSAYYFDTADNLLAKQGIALRIRYENGQWVQTLKTHGDGIAKRIELNTVLPIRQTPTQIDVTTLKPDLAHITNLTVIAQLTKIMPIDILNQTLQVRYFTDIERIYRIIKKNNSQIEVAYDIGKVAIGKAPKDSYPIHELEFELITGEVADLIDITKSWCISQKLYLSTVTKAHRGSLLLAKKQHIDPVKADLTALQFDKHIGELAFLQKIVHHCLSQILPNATAIANGSQNAEHIHQLRVGIRRLRTVFKVFDNSHINPAWQTTLKRTFAQLGEYRDKQILQTKTQPMLQQHNAAPIHWSLDVAVLPVEAVKDSDFQLLLLDLINFTHLPMTDKMDKAKAKQIAKQKLNKWFKKVRKNSEKFAELDTDSQHQIRKDLKTLRYLTEFVAPLFYQNKKQATYRKNKQAVKKFLAYLEPAQDVLGDYNDNVVGRQYYAERAEYDRNALFAVGWFAGRQASHAKQCAETLKMIRYTPIFWKK
nr:CYTH and CHAD domain-containing protein [uncultured Moraxella sp.]